MPKTTNSTVHLKSSYSWLWLVIGAGLMVFVPAQTSLAFAAWLAPVFLLRFTRTIRPLIALPALGVAVSLAMLVAFRGGLMPFSGFDFYIAIVGIGLAYTAVFAIDRFLWRRFKGVVSTLVFPLASTAVGFIATLGNPIGTAGSEAYAQTDLNLIQLVSVTGIWGLVFLMAWFGSTVNFLWERGFDLKRTRLIIGLYAGVALAVLVFGSVRLAFFSPIQETVRVAAIAPVHELMQQSRGLPLGSDEERQASRASLEPLVDDLFARSEEEAKAGAKIIAWSEGSARVLKEDEAQLLDRAKSLAVQYGIYLQLGLSPLLNPNEFPEIENRAVMITPDGAIAWDYHKTKITPGDPEKSGPGLLPSIDTPYGKLSTVICQDDLFPELLTQAGRKGVDMLLVPSNDWEAVAGLHAHIATFRAIENGVAIVRPTAQGVSLATDSTGRLLAQKADYFIAQDQTMIANIPVHGNMTALYPYIGDTIAYLSAGGVVLLGGIAIVRRRNKTD